MPHTRPTLLVGLGGSGAKVLIFAKRALINAYGGVPDNVKLLCFDTVAPGSDRREGAKDYFGGVTLTPGEEYIHISQGANVADAGPNVLRWFPKQRFISTFGNMSITDGAAAHRPVGRLSLYIDLQKMAGSQVVAAIRNSVDRIVRADRASAAGQRRVQIALVSSLAGGTGAGLVTDVAALLRHLTTGRQVHLSTLLIMPDAFGAWDDTNAEDRQKQARSYAIWREFGRMRLTGQAAAPYEFDFLSFGRFKLREPLADAVYLLGGRRSNGATLDPVGSPEEHVFPACAHFLYLLMDDRTQTNEGGQQHDSIVQIAENQRSMQNGASEPLYAALGTWVERSVASQVERDYARHVNKAWLEAVNAPFQTDRRLQDGTAVRLFEWAPDRNPEAPNSPGGAAVGVFLKSSTQQYGEQQAPVTPFANTIGGVCYPIDDRAKMELREAFLGGAWRDDIEHRFVMLSGASAQDVDAFNHTTGQDHPDLIVEGSRTPGMPKPEFWPFSFPRFDPKLQKVYGGNELAGGRINPGSYGSALSDVVAAQTQRFRSGLRVWLQHHLMGDDAKDFVKARSGKPGYCLDFMRRLSGDLQEFRNYLAETVRIRDGEMGEGQTMATAAYARMIMAKQEMEDNCRRGWWSMIAAHIAPLILFILFTVITILGFSGVPEPLLLAFPQYPFVGLGLSVLSLVWLVLALSPFVPPNLVTQDNYIQAVQLYIQRRREELLLGAMADAAERMQQVANGSVQALLEWQKAMVGDPDLNRQGVLTALDVEVGREGQAVHELRADAVQKLHISAITPDGLPPNLLSRTLQAVEWRVEDPPGELGLQIGLTLHALEEGQAAQTLQPGANERALRANVQALAQFGAATMGALRDEQRIMPRLMYAYEDNGQRLGEALQLKAEPMLGVTGVGKMEQWISAAPANERESAFLKDAVDQLRARQELLTNTTAIGCDDPYTLTYLRIDSSFREENVTVYGALQGLYQAVARTWATASDDEFASKRMHVLPAEQNAMQLGLRLARLYGRGAIEEFHPLVVACLENKDRATQFLWAWLLGYIRREVQRQEETWEVHTPIMRATGPDTLELPVITLARCATTNEERMATSLMQAWTNFVNFGANTTGLDAEGNPIEDAGSTVPFDVLRDVVDYRLRADGAEALRAKVLGALHPERGVIGRYRRVAGDLRQLAQTRPDQTIVHRAKAYEDISKVCSLLLVDSCAAYHVDLGIGEKTADPIGYDARLRDLVSGRLPEA